ncbi:MAG TPA: TetR/AcrR family transcriptional regulator [Thermoleophilia bacterium]|nr:TetR/AcrR family transcriptional regulator [Thermoleophilia bacterium]
MPKVVDRDQRRDEIVQAALELLGEGGPRLLTMRALGRKLGGSLRLVNHYYPTRRSLLEGLESQLTERFTADLEELDAELSNPNQRLHSFLLWSLTLDDGDRIEERAWLSLLSAPPEDHDAIASMHRKGAEWTRVQLVSRLAGIVPEEAVQLTADRLQILLRGIVVLAAENPEMWPPDRQISAMEDMLGQMGLTHVDGDE